MKRKLSLLEKCALAVIYVAVFIILWQEKRERTKPMARYISRR